jgi:hypothetical protein
VLILPAPVCLAAARPLEASLSFRVQRGIPPEGFRVPAVFAVTRVLLLLWKSLRDTRWMAQRALLLLIPSLRRDFHSTRTI